MNAGRLSTCAALSTGELRCWGRSPDDLFTGSTSSFNPTPTAVAGIQGVIDVAVGENLICALTTGRVISCWGYNFGGGVGAPLPLVPTPVRLGI